MSGIRWVFICVFLYLRILVFRGWGLVEGWRRWVFFVFFYLFCYLFFQQLRIWCRQVRVVGVGMSFVVVGVQERCRGRKWEESFCSKRSLMGGNIKKIDVCCRWALGILIYLGQIFIFFYLFITELIQSYLSV